MHLIHIAHIHSSQYHLFYFKFFMLWLCHPFASTMHPSLCHLVSCCYLVLIQPPFLFFLYPIPCVHRAPRFVSLDFFPFSVFFCFFFSFSICISTLDPIACIRISICQFGDSVAFYALNARVRAFMKYKYIHWPPKVLMHS